jgi:hypothetical protein
MKGCLHSSARSKKRGVCHIKTPNTAGIVAAKR